MVEIRLKKLVLRDFQGGTIVVDANGNNLNVFAANGAGKTRLMSAMLWLLTGKDSLGRSDFSIKNLDASGNQEHGLEHTVEAVFIVGGNDLTLKKTYHELWTKKRGSAQAVFTGHCTDHFIDGVPVKENEYKTRISEIFGDEERFRLLTNPSAFALMPWQKQRSLLLSVCGDIPDAEIIASDDTLAPLSSALSKYTVSKTPLDDLKKVTMGRRTEINKQIDQIPVRIDEARRGLPDVTGLDKAALDAQIVTLEGELNTARLRLAGVDTGGKIAPLTKELNTVASEISSIENSHYLHHTEVVTRLNQQIRSFAESREAEVRKLKSMTSEVEEKKTRMVSLDKSLDLLRDKWNGIDGEEFQDTTQCVCAACGQNLPEDKVEAAREKAKATFNISKSERLSYVQSEGKRLRAERDRIVGEIEQLSASMPVIGTEADPDTERAIMDRDAAKAAAADYSGIVGRQDLIDRKAALEKAINDEKEAVAGDRNDISDEIAEISRALAEAKEKADRFVRRESGEKRIQALKAEEKTLAGEFEALEKLLFLIETFIKNKVSLLTGRINEKFKVVSFRLFENLVNGGISEICEMTVNGVGYNSGLNNAARINGGLDIIRTLQEHYGIAPTVFIDNRESVSEIPEMDCQIVNLIVSPRDACLRVERAEKAARLAA